MNVLVACECSGTVRDAFRARGHNAWSCDIMPSDRSQDYHYQCDMHQMFYHEIVTPRWDLVIAHPPCTRICNSGVCWLEKRNLWGQLELACRFFRMFLELDVPKLVIENPIPHKYAIEQIGVKYDQIIQPWQFGHGETKATCLWLRGLPKLKPTNIVSGREQRLHRLPPSADRAKQRSKTYQGIADAMAEQWGGVIT